jgi:hypothetical protein
MRALLWLRYRTGALWGGALGWNPFFRPYGGFATDLRLPACGLTGLFVFRKTVNRPVFASGWRTARGRYTGGFWMRWEGKAWSAGYNNRWSGHSVSFPTTIHRIHCNHPNSSLDKDT